VRPALVWAAWVEAWVAECSKLSDNTTIFVFGLPVQLHFFTLYEWLAAIFSPLLSHSDLSYFMHGSAANLACLYHI